MKSCTDAIFILQSSSNHKRRRSSAKDAGKANADSNVDASSAEDMANDDTDDGDEDESSGKKKLEKNKKKFTRSNKGRKTGPNTPKRRRSRISSFPNGCLYCWGFFMDFSCYVF